MAARSGSGRKKLNVVVVSGGTARTGERVVQSALAQFDGAGVRVTLRPRVRTVRAALAVIRSIRSKRAIVCHTLVQPEVREAVIRECQRRDLHAVDLLGPTLRLLADHLESAPRNQPGLSYELNKEQFDRIDAVDFTLAHDDGARVGELDRADVVLVGPSRVSKSVTCFYLAYRGIRAANVPLVPGIQEPAELRQLDPDKVVSLTMNPHRLCHVREARQGAIRQARLADYADLRQITRELRDAQALVRQYGWRQIDVSYMAVEEVAGEVIELIMARAA